MKTRASLFFRRVAVIIAGNNPGRRRRGPKLIAAAAAVAACLTTAPAAAMTQAPAMRAAAAPAEANARAARPLLAATVPAHPRPAHAPVIKYLPHPVQVPVTDNRKNALYLLCLANAPTYCAAFDTIGTIGLVLGTISVVCVFVDCPEVLRKYTIGSGRHQKMTLQVEMAYSGTTNPHRHDCIGANPTPSDGNNGVYLSRPSQCFGHNQTSWQVVPEPHGSFELWNEQGLSYGRNFRLFNIKPKVGYRFYVVPASQPGWTKYVLENLGTCVRYC